jgi:hypothetical protein
MMFDCLGQSLIEPLAVLIRNDRVGTTLTASLVLLMFSIYDSSRGDRAMAIQVEPTKSSRIRAALVANPDLSEAELSAQTGISRRDIRTILKRNPLWRPKSVNRGDREA